MVKHGTMLFSLERAEMKITQSRILLRIHRVQSYFPQSRENQKPSVKNIVNGSQGTMLFSQKRAKLKMTQSKTALTLHQCYFPKKEQK